MRLVESGTLSRAEPGSIRAAHMLGTNVAMLQMTRATTLVTANSQPVTTTGR